MKKIMSFLALVLFLNGCTWVSTSEKINTFEQDKKINTKSSFYMVQPKNGYEKTYFAENHIENENSAQQVSEAFFYKFNKTFGSLVRSEENMTMEEALKTAKARGDQYLITMDIDEWNPQFYMTCRSTTTGAGDTVTKVVSIDVSIQVYDVKTGDLLNKQRLQNSGCAVVVLNVIPFGTLSPSGRFNDSLNKWYMNIQESTKK